MTLVTASGADGATGHAGDRWTATGLASRLLGARRRRSVPHLLLGVVLVLSCVAALLLVAVSGEDRRQVLALARAVAVGQVLAPQDLRQVMVTIGSDVSVIAADRASSVLGRTVAANLPAGTLLPPDAVGAGPTLAAGEAIAALPLTAGQFPTEVGPGTSVTVVMTSATEARPDPRPTPSAPTIWSAVVTSVSAPLYDQTTVVSVLLTTTAAIEVAAVPAGQLSLVIVGGR